MGYQNPECEYALCQHFLKLANRGLTLALALLLKVRVYGRRQEAPYHPSSGSLAAFSTAVKSLMTSPSKQ